MLIYVLASFIISVIGSMVCTVGFYVTPIFSSKSDKFLFVGVISLGLWIYTTTVLIAYFIELVVIGLL